jgi:hypothetical protein
MKLLILIAGAISKEFPLNLKTANRIFKKGILTIHSNSYMVKRIPITE